MPRSFSVIGVGLVAFLYATFAAYQHCPSDPIDLEVDGWAEKIKLAMPGRLSFQDVLSSPSLWKGPITPTIYNLSYYIVPSPYSVLAVNILAFSLASALLFHTFAKYSGQRFPAVLAILAWILYWPHRMIFGYYFSEPLITLFAAIALNLLLSQPKRPMLVGAMLGFLLLARPPFLLVAMGVPLVVLAVDPAPFRQRIRWVVLFTVGFLAIFSTWTVRNLLEYRALVPFTVEGGQTLFHGSYLPLEEDRWQVLKQDPTVAAIVARAPEDPIERMHYFSGLAKQQFLADPVGQMVRCVRKGIKFWTVLEPGSWKPKWKSALAATLGLTLAFCTLIQYWRVPVIRWSALWLLGVWGMHTLVFGTLRYNFPVLPMLFFLAASAIWKPRHEFAKVDSATPERSSASGPHG